MTQPTREQSLSDLKPEWGVIYRDRELTRDNGGFPTDEFHLTFICPSCGPPHVIMIRIASEMRAKTHAWKADPMPDGIDWPSRVTISPSINNTGAGHGRKHPTCDFHGHIVKGKVVRS